MLIVEILHKAQQKRSTHPNLFDQDCSRTEIKKAIGHLKNGKAPGSDNIRVELLKADIDYATTKLKEIMDIVLRDKKTPRKWRKGLIVKLLKRGNLKNCKN